VADPKLLASHRDTVQVDYSLFYIEDEETPWFGDDTAEPPEAPAEGELARSGRDWITIGSNVNYHVAGVTLELWDSEPTPPDHWEVSTEVDLPATKGRIYLNNTSGTSSETYELDGPGTYHVRISSRGRDEAQEALSTSGSVPERMEQYLIQFWKAR
jgi:hypothetical protein